MPTPPSPRQDAEMKNPGRIPIVAAERLSSQYDVPMVVVFAVHPDRENFTVTTYGQTKKFCRLAAAYGEQLAKAVWDAAVKVQQEPVHLPETPTIMRPAAIRRLIAEGDKDAE